MDARLLNEPIVCSLEDIRPIHMSRDNSKAAARLRALAEHNNTEHQRAVSSFVRLTGNARAIKVNERRRNSGGN